MPKFAVIALMAIIFLLIDYYVFQGIKVAIQNLNANSRKSILIVYWTITIVSLLGFFTYHFLDPDLVGRKTRSFIMVGLFMNYFSKLFMVLVLFVGDLVRGGQWIYQTVASFFSDKPVPAQALEGEGITRSEFLAKTGIVFASIPLTGMAYGILSGAHDYRVKKERIFLPNLPTSFDGMTIAQISDIHSGSFFIRSAVKRGVEMLMAQKPDVVFFTGDLVNNQASEVKNYLEIFSKINAPYGVYSVLGNHDYGDYISWPSQGAKVKNLQNLKDAHGAMGWKLLMNENIKLKSGADEIAVIGIENWGAKGNFPKYGRLADAYKGSEESPVKLLLSHDPSHWDAQVRTEFKDIDIMFAGHTHGMQFGVEVAGIKWSPVQYMYKQWAGLYQEGQQYLYVNRGFGYLGFPGRVGMPPEITIFELKCKPV